MRRGASTQAGAAQYNLIAVTGGSDIGSMREKRLRLIINGKPTWLHIDGVGVVCASIVYTILVGSNAVIMRCVLISISPIWGIEFVWCHIILYNALFAMAVSSHFVCMTTDPGCVPVNAHPLSEYGELVDDNKSNMSSSGANSHLRYKRNCKKCQSYKPRHAHHCSVCGRCVLYFDHFCPWINNAIGIMNQKLFIQFIFSVMGICGYSMVLILIKFSICEGRETSNIQCKYLTTQNNFLVFFVLFLACIFGLFTACMACDQLATMQHSDTKVERLKAENNHDLRAPSAHKSRHTNVERIFGNVYNSGNILWYINLFIPTPPKYTPETREAILGYTTESDSNICIDESSPLINEHNIDNINNNNNDDAFSNDDK